ncbi:MAG TPA: VOC family protein [Reyranella sp.]|jgi:catechol 2,3-dioxygenase-like lactoylglutathione lyase family enzyme|nr:VOC family protein [Reyranella sp.]
MIDALDHLVLRASFRAGAVGAYETLLGRQAEDGRLRVGNVGLTIEDHASTAQLSAMVFVTASLDKAKRLLERRAVPCERKGEQLVLSTIATHGVPIALVERTEAPAAAPLLKSSEAAAVSSLDHVVVRTPNPERAVALYAGRLGLDLRLDRSNPEWGSRLLFFRCGDLVVEIAHDLKKGVSDAPDQLWGLSWRAPDIAKANERLKKAGVEVSEPRRGRRPGTQVFSVQSHTANVPTIVIGGLEHWS